MPPLFFKPARPCFFMTWRQLGPRRGKRRGLLRGAVTIPEGLEERSFSLPPTPQSRSRRNRTPPGGKNRSHLSRGVVFHSGSLTQILFPSYTTGYTQLVNHPTPVHAASVCICTPTPRPSPLSCVFKTNFLITPPQSFSFVLNVV